MAKKPLRISDDANDLQNIEFGDDELAGIGGLDLGNLGTHLLERDGDDMTFTDVNAGGPWTLSNLLGLNGVGIGRITPVYFVGSGNTSNKWLDFATGSLSSDSSPFVGPFTRELFAFGYSNSNDNTDCDIEIYKNGITATELEETIEIRNSRNAWGAPPSNVSYAPGDSLHVFLTNQGGNSANVVMVLWFRTTAAGIGSGSLASATY